MNDPNTTHPSGPEPQPSDPRFTRISHGVLATGVFGAFVFASPWVLAACALLIGSNATGGTRFGPLNWLAAKILRPQPASPNAELLSSPDADAGPRFAEAIATALLATAAALIWNHTPVIGWAIAILVGVAAVVTATTHICPGCMAYKFLFQRSHP